MTIRLKTVEQYFTMVLFLFQFSSSFGKFISFGLETVRSERVDQFVFLFLGAAQSSLSSVERYDPRTNTWTMVAPMNMRRSLLNVAVLDGEKSSV